MNLKQLLRSFINNNEILSVFCNPSYLIYSIYSSFLIHNKAYGELEESKYGFNDFRWENACKRN